MNYTFKWHLLCPFLQYVILVLGAPQTCEVSAQNTLQIIYYNIWKMSFLGRVYKIAVLVCITLNANELHMQDCQSADVGGAYAL